MRKDYYAAHVSQNLPRLDKDAAANGCNVAHMRGSVERRGFDTQPCPAYFTLRIDPRLVMAKPKPIRQDEKAAALARDGALNPHPEAVRDPLFSGNPFFDPRDLVQVRYEMVRRHQVDSLHISDVADVFGVSRPTFYKAQSALADHGLAGLAPQRRGPKDGHKISAEVLAYVDELKAATPDLTMPQYVAAIANRFGVRVHRRSLERALARKKKRIDSL